MLAKSERQSCTKSCSDIKRQVDKSICYQNCVLTIIKATKCKKGDNGDSDESDYDEHDDDDNNDDDDDKDASNGKKR